MDALAAGRPASSSADAGLDAGRRLHAAGDLAGAEAIYRRLIHEDRADAPEALHLLGLSRYQHGDHGEAVRLIAAALARAPRLSGAWHNLILPLLALDRTGEAVAAARQAVAAAPDSAGAAINAALAYLRSGLVEAAGEAAETAVALDPASPLGWMHLGHARQKAGRLAVAERHFRRALALDPQAAEGWAGLGETLYAAGRYADSAAAWRRAHDLSPADPIARTNLGAALRATGDQAAAIAVWEGGAPTAEARYNAGCARLSIGDWRGGWAGYEQRLAIPIEPAPPAVADLPLWDGGPLDGTLLVHHEQGLGDTIQMAALLPRLLDRVSRVVLVCQRPLRALLAASAPLQAAGERIVVVSDGTDLPPVAAWLPAMSVPHRLGLDPDRDPPPLAPLVADPARVARWRAWLDGAAADAGRSDGLRVGLVWQGNPKAPAERGRSLPLASLAPLVQVPGVVFVSLQMGAGREQIGTAGALAPLDPGPDFDAGGDGFLDTLALCRSLDLVVAVDTAVAHVAAGAGRPVGLLLRHVPDWRWGCTGEATAWYPSVRLMRQRDSGDWSEPVAAAAAWIAAFAAARTAGDPSGQRYLDAGLAAHHAGRLDEALAHYAVRLRLAPLDATAANYAALATLDAVPPPPNAIAAAASLARRSVALAPDQSDLVANAATVLRRTGHTDEAERWLRQVLVRDPAHGPAVQNIVNLLTAADRAADAVRVATAAVAASPRDVGLLKALARGLEAAGEGGQAAAVLRHALTLAPGDGDAALALGRLLAELDDQTGAKSVFEALIAADPGSAVGFSNLGVIEKRLSGPELAVWLYHCALRRDPQQVDALANLGSALVELGRWEQAAAVFERALALRPDHPEARMALGMTKLADGRFAEGFSDYEGRIGSARLGLAASAPALPRWQGEHLVGRTLLVLCEQGFGDAIHFVRYAGLTKAKGAGQVLVGCRRRLATLLASAHDVDGTIPEGGALPKDGVYAHLMSLPHLTGTTLETIPAAVPYLDPDPLRAEDWAIRLSARDGFRIGLVWQGNPDPSVDRGRSLPLAALEPLARIPGVRLIALQKGPGAEQVAALGGRFAVETLGDDFDGGPDAFVDTAAVMVSLDLIVSTDTAALHLAGALGRPAFGLVKAHAEWRWLTQRADSPWYPTLRLFRQSEAEAAGADGFAGAIGRLAAAVAALVAGDRMQLHPPRGALHPVDRPTPPPVEQRFAHALALHRAGRRAEAEALYAGILVDHPRHAETVHMLGALALQRLDYRRADLFFREAAAYGLATPEFATNRAVALRRLGDVATAETLFRAVIEMAPSAEAHSNLGGLLADREAFDEALDHLHRAAELAPDLASTHRLLGTTLREAGQPVEGLAALERAAALDPDDAEIRIDRAHARLALGDIRGGFADYLYRWRGSELVPRALDAPEWDGAPFAGTLLVHGEQGLGDQIQFARFLAAAAARVGAVILEVRRPLLALFAQLDLPLTLVEQGTPLPPHDRQIPMMSLPAALDLDAEGIGMAAPYLSADPDRIALWRGRLGPFDGPTVALVWQGNPKARADKGRSPPLAALAPLLELPGLRFVALQKEHGLADLGPFRDRLILPALDHADFDGGDGAFLDSAAILSLCDLAIASDTALAHLAGALARPTFLLLKQVPDWRWGVSGDTTPWYPLLRLFRQRRRGDWSAPVAEVVAALSALGPHGGAP